MQISAKKLPRNRFRYEISLTVLEVAEHFEHALSHLATQVKVPGFRPGKAPAGMVREQLQAETLREEAYSLAVHDAWQKVVSGLKELPIQDPVVEIKQFSEGEPAKIDFEFDVRPTVKVKDIGKIKLKTPSTPAVADQEVADVIESLRRANAKTTVKLEVAEAGDKLEITFSGSLGGIKKDKLSSKHFPLILGEPTVVPGFAEELIGLKRGETKKFSLRFPKDHFDKELADQKVEFEATVEEVYQVNLPAKDADLAKKFGHSTLAKLEQAIRKDLAQQKTEELMTQRKAEWLAQFEKLVNTEVPISLIDAEIARSRANWQQFLAERQLTPERWLADRQTSLEKMENDWRKAAESSVKIGLGLAQIAQEKKRSLKSQEDYHKLLDDLVKATNAKS